MLFSGFISKITKIPICIMDGLKTKGEKSYSKCNLFKYLIICVLNYLYFFSKNLKYRKILSTLSRIGLQAEF